ncbi:MAG TPA: hypothetical protein VGI40_06320 [Pirellulaceae bacterium]|jgi:hypothetical protein
MFCVPNSDSAHHRPQLIAAGLILCILSLPTAARGKSPIAEINSAESANNEQSRAIENRLALEKSKLEKLIELQQQGHATWLEVAHCQVAVASLEAQLKSAREFALFVSALRQHIAASAPDHGDNPSNDSDWLSALPAITFQLAAARAQAHGDLQAARLSLQRHQLRAATIEQLAATSAATSEEQITARRDLQTAQSLVNRVSSQHERDVQSHHELLQSSAACDFTDHIAALSVQELHPDELPSRLLTRGDFVHSLLQLRHNHHLATSRRETITFQRSLTNELLIRTETAQRQTHRANSELNRLRLDREILQAEQSAADERRTLLHLEELWFVAASAPQPIDALPPVLRIDSPTSALPIFAQGLGTHLSAGQQSPLTAAAWQPVAPNWPINNWSATRQLVAPSLPLSGNANVRYSEPNYADFYINGNRRLDAPSISNNFFRSGGLPWYLPGSTTNFK